MADRRPDASTPPLLLGRRRECGELDGLFTHVRRGQSAVLVLRGEAGIGKTALLQYLIDAASGLMSLRCSGAESEMGLAFAGLHELCAPLFGDFGSLPEPQRVALSVALGLEAGPSPDKFVVGLATLNLLAAASERGPVMCFVEDAHWLEQASAQVLGFVGRRLLAEPVGLVFAAHAPVLEPNPLQGLPEWRVEGLDQPAARALLDKVQVATRAARPRVPL